MDRNLNRLMIDKDELDTELAQQSALVYSSRMELAEAISERDGQKEYLGRLEAVLRPQLQDMLQVRGVAKPTIKDVECALELDPNWQEQRGKYLELSRRVEERSAFVDSVRSRDFMLKSLNDSLVSQRWITAGESGRDPSEVRARASRRPLDD